MSKKQKFKKPRKIDRDSDVVELETALKTKKWEYDFEVNSKFTFNYVQQSFLETMLRPETSIGIIDGLAGTAKTYLAVYAALKLMSQRKIENIVYIRSVVESASKSVGFLPGELDEKFAPYSMPLFDKLDELVSPAVQKNLIGSNMIRFVPVNFARGLTFRDSFVIIDEAQNLTYNELTTLLTRLGEGTKYAIIGDTMQTDIGKHNSGFLDIVKKFNDSECESKGIYSFAFTDAEVVRHPLLRFIIKRLNIH